jgi:hypothetical protein
VLYLTSSALTHCCSVAWPIRHDLVPLFGYANLYHGVCPSESFNNLLAPPFPPPACPQNNPDMGRLLPTVAVAAELDGATISKAQDRFPRAHLASRLDGQSSPAQATHMKSLSRHPNSHTNLLPHSLNQGGLSSIKASHQQRLP